MLPLALALAVSLSAAPAAPRAKSAAPGAPPRLPSVEATFAHELSTPNGPVLLSWPSLAYDRAHDELFVVAEGFVRIFDASGMEVYRFGDDGALGNILRVAVLDDGDLILLTTLNDKRAYLRCDFRGELIETLSLTGLPKALAGFEPDQLVHRGGKLFFAERGTMRVVVTDVAGAYRHHVRLRDLVATALANDPERKPPGAMDGFNVDSAGNVLFTMSTLFAGGVATRSGALRLFGTRGSTPGRFNIIGGIDSDEAGNVYVTDRLRSVVSVWDRELRHLGDFGYRGDDEGSLATPFELAVGNGKVFVTQAGKRGVKVWRVRLVEPQPAPERERAAPPPTSPARSPTKQGGLG
jgi:hypothetical protein